MGASLLIAPPNRTPCRIDQPDAQATYSCKPPGKPGKESSCTEADSQYVSCPGTVGLPSIAGILPTLSSHNDNLPHAQTPSAGLYRQSSHVTSDAMSLGLEVSSTILSWCPDMISESPCSRCSSTRDCARAALGSPTTSQPLQMANPAQVGGSSDHLQSEGPHSNPGVGGSFYASRKKLYAPVPLQGLTGVGTDPDEAGGHDVSRP